MRSTAASPAVAESIDERVAFVVREGLTAVPKRLPPWLFYDAAGSRLFEQITTLPEYYLTRTERAILAAHGPSIMARAAGGSRLRIAELGAGSAEKTRLLLKAAVERQGAVMYAPIDVSASALDVARVGIERDLPGVFVTPLVMDYTDGEGRGLNLAPAKDGERMLVLYIGSSIGNFHPEEAGRLLRRLRTGMEAGDSLLLGVDLVKDGAILHAAYDDAAGVTEAFNKNLLARLNRELGCDFDPEAFAHRAVWNEGEARIEMHLESRLAQRVRIAALDFEAEFAEGETIHTENSYKFRPGQAEAMLAEAGFRQAGAWTDARGWFAVHLAQAE
jgi:L-histidine Nalpha-methyltransferase